MHCLLSPEISVTFSPTFLGEHGRFHDGHALNFIPVALNNVQINILSPVITNVVRELGFRHTFLMHGTVWPL